MSTSFAGVDPSTQVVSSSGSGYDNPAFWERLWRASGLLFVAFLIITSLLNGLQPQVGASADVLDAFYLGDRTRILIAAAVSGLNLLNLLWFVAALRVTLADAGQDGWGAAATVSSAAFGVLYLLQIAIGAAVAYSSAGSANQGLASGLNDISWALAVVSAFPRAMLIMSGAFGLWRARLISSSLFAYGVGAVVLGVLGGTTWLSSGVWAPDGAYTRFASPSLLLIWVVVVSRVLLARAPATRAGW
jgi:hypothetical protein